MDHVKVGTVETNPLCRIEVGLNSISTENPCITQKSFSAAYTRGYTVSSELAFTFKSALAFASSLTTLFFPWCHWQGLNSTETTLLIPEHQVVSSEKYSCFLA